MLIGDLAKRTGLTSDTIRFYEKLGLLDERFIRRGANNYRHYSDAAADRIRVIQSLQAACFTLAEIKTLLDRWDAGTLTPADGELYLQQKVDDIDRRIAEFEQMKATMRTLAARHGADHSPKPR